MKKKYEELKIELYNKYKDERNKYTHGKDKYIKEVINKAIKEIKAKIVKLTLLGKLR